MGHHSVGAEWGGLDPATPVSQSEAMLQFSPPEARRNADMTIVAAHVIGPQQRGKETVEPLEWTAAQGLTENNHAGLITQPGPQFREGVVGELMKDQIADDRTVAGVAGKFL